MSRFRSFQKDAPQSITLANEHDSNVDYPQNELVPGVMLGGIHTIQEMTDEEHTSNRRICNPMVKSQKVSSSLAGSKWTCVSEVPGWEKTQRDYFTAVKHCMPTVGTWTLPSSDSFVFEWDSLVVQLADLVKGTLSNKSSLLVTLKEMSKTVEMVRNPFNLMHQNWRSIAKGFTPLNLARKGTNIWLESTYGWKALNYDIANFCEAYARFDDARTLSGLSPKDQEEPFHVKQTLSFSPPIPLISDASWEAYLALEVPCCNEYNGQYRFVAAGPGRAVGSISCRRTRALAHVFHTVDSLVGTLGLRTRDLLPALWEIVPYSFVVDWFINVGDGINGLLRNEAANFLQETVHTLGYSVAVSTDYNCQWIPGAPWAAEWPFIVTSVYPRGFTGTLGSIRTVERHSGLPSSESYLSSSGLSFTRSVSGLSLLFQRLDH